MKFLWNFIVQKRGYRSIEVSPILLAKVSKYRALHKADTFGTSSGNGGSQTSMGDGEENHMQTVTIIFTFLFCVLSFVSRVVIKQGNDRQGY